MFKSELEFEKQLVETLLQKGWSNVLKNPSEKELIENWAKILFLNNRDIDRLSDYPLIESEMRQIIEQIDFLKTPARLNDFINGKTISIKRENPDHKELFGKEISLKIYDRKEIAGGSSTYQIVQQPQFSSKSLIYPDRRGDLMLLINGMPVIHIELKRSGVDVSQATNQIKKYHHENVFTGIYSLVQIFVAMTPERTLYFANPGDYRLFNPDYYFTWADFYNNPINNWRDIASNLLSIPMAHTMIGFYTIADNTDGMLKVMRSYQYYAAWAITNKVRNTDWSARNIYGGYVWHTTGSGKTMTSFKSAELIANNQSADKVVFLVDRVELGTQSLQQYRNFAGSMNDVQATENTNVLITKLKSSNPVDTLIVTTIQKMSNIKEESAINQKDIELMNKKRIVFVVDEAHRSTFGIMLATIKRTFPRAVFFGFTGTPIHDENAKNMNTTADIFGDELHRYLISDGIRDKNVLGFDPYFVSTFRDKDLREAVALHKTKSKTLDEIFNDPNKTQIYNEIMKLPMFTKYDNDNNKIIGIEEYIPTSQYRTKEHQKAVVKDISEDWDKFSRGGKFHALFATSSIKEAIQYYELFKKLAPSIKVACLFDPSDQNNDHSIFKLQGLATMLTDYNEMFKQNFNISSYDLYKKDIAIRLAHKHHYMSIEDDRSQTLDLLIVVNQMLTGYDSKWINTLYLDKVLVQESVVQAFSRTNRIFGYEKPFGNIKYYRKPYTMKINIEEAFRSYSGNKPFGVFVDKLPKNLHNINKTYNEIKNIFVANEIYNFEKNPDDENSRKKFASKFREFNKYLEASIIQGFTWKKGVYNFPELKEKIKLNLNEYTYLILVIRYRELFSQISGTIRSDSPYELDAHLTEINTEHIDNEYLNSRFKKYIEELKNDDPVLIEKTLNDLHSSFASLTQEEQKHADSFLFDVRTNKIVLDPEKTFKDYVIEYMNNAKNNRITMFCKSFGIDEVVFKQFMGSYNRFNPNEFGNYDKLKDTIDYTKAKTYLEQKHGKTFRLFDVVLRVDEEINNFLNDEFRDF